MLLLIILLYHLESWFLQGSLGLRITGLSVPSEVQVGGDVFLQCHFDLEGSNLYALKWYKGQHEFYRFILKEVPPVQIFPWANVNIIHNEATSWRTTMSAAAASTAGRVLLQNVTSAAEGVYKCEVSTEAPNFDTDYKESNLSIIEVRNERPTISLVQGRLTDWTYGDVFHFKCSMNGTRPASRLSWFLNGQPAPPGLVEPSDPVLINGYYNTQLGLRIQLLPQLFESDSQMEVTCLSRVGGMGTAGGRHETANQNHQIGERINPIQSRAVWIISYPSIPPDPPDDPSPSSSSSQEGSSNNISNLTDTAQSEVDGPPSRRTQPVVIGSYPGRVSKNNGVDSNANRGVSNKSSSSNSSRTSRSASSSSSLALLVTVMICEFGTSNMTGLRKGIWSAVVLLSLVLVLVHGGGLLLRFQTYPIRIQLSMADERAAPLPALTVCPLDRFDLTRLEHLWKELLYEKGSNSGDGPRGNENAAVIPLDPKEQYYQLAGMIPIDQLWERIAYHNATSLFPLCFVGRGTECSSVGTFQSVWTPSGTCFTYWSDRKTLSGHFHGLYLRLNISHQLSPSMNASGWKITVHEPGVSPVLTSSRQYTQIGIRYDPEEAVDGGTNVRSQFVNSRLIPKRFVQVNRPQNPCADDNAALAECELDCFERAVANITRCKLPYMRTNEVPYCNTSASVRRAEEVVAELITESRSSFRCPCIDPCTKIVYKYQSESLTVNMDYGRLKVFYDTTLWCTVREVFIYSWIKLLCDAGNILCLLLGASLLGLFHVAETGILIVSSWIWKKSDNIN